MDLTCILLLCRLSFEQMFSIKYRLLYLDMGTFYFKTKPMKIYLSLLLLLIGSFSFAQREFGVNDSTFYPLNADTTIIAGPKKLYFNSAAGTTLIWDFTTRNDNFYPRDLDIITDTLWYAIVGSRYIGGDTELYKTTDKGASWSRDTSFYAVGRGLVNDNYRSLNQMQGFSEDTIVLFVGYYESGIAYSIDGGNSWLPWFSNLISNYHGIFSCGNDYYLFGLEGDGFSSSMFKFADSLLFSPDTNSVWTPWAANSYHPACNNRDSACIFAPNSISRYDQYRYHRDYVDSVCATVTSVMEYEQMDAIQIYPNPLKSGTPLSIEHQLSSQKVSYQIFNAQGKLVGSGPLAQKISTSNLVPGFHLIVFHAEDRMLYRRFIVQNR